MLRLYQFLECGLFLLSQAKQERQCKYNVILWRVHVTIVAVERQQCITCVAELYITVKYIKILSVAQQCF